MYTLWPSEYGKSDRGVLIWIDDIELLVFADQYSDKDNHPIDIQMVHLQEHLLGPTDYLEL